MNLDEMILVTENWKGTETNALMTFNDFLKYIDIEKLDTQTELAEIMADLGRTLGKREEWAEIYFVANKSVSARYCTDTRQLQQFLLGSLNSIDQEVRFSEDLSSDICLKKMKTLGLNSKGWMTGLGYHYEKQEAEYYQGDILHNFNGNDYRVMEKLSDRNLLLMDVHTGNFTVALGMDTFVRYPKGETPDRDNCVKGIEWGHGVYLGATPSEIDFQGIRKEYGDMKQFQIEIKEELSRVEPIEAETLGEAIDKAMDLYYGEKIVLDAEDMKGVDFQPMQEEPGKSR